MINRLFNLGNNKDVDRVIVHTMQSLLECGLLLADKYNISRISHIGIMESCLEYCTLLGQSGQRLLRFN